ncbi:MAG: hypothetical protein WEE36_05615 [Acidimicrobiia bacterium]
MTPDLGTRRRLAILTIAVAITGATVVVALPAGAAVSLSEVEAAEQELDEATAALAASEAELAEAEIERSRLDSMLARLAERESDLENEASFHAQSVRARIARMYMVAQSGSSQLVVTDVASFSSRLAYLGAIAERDRSEVIDLAFTGADIVDLRAEVQEAIGHWEGEIASRAVVVAERRSVHAEVRTRFESLREQWQREEAARQEALEAEIRRQEEELANQTTSTAGTPTTRPNSTTTTVIYPYVPSEGVEQWRSLVGEVFGRWGLDQTKCATRDGVEFCVGSQVDNALSVMQCESGGNPMARNPSSGASGLFQHLASYWQYRVDRVRSLHPDKSGGLPADASIFNPDYNATVAALLVWESRETLLGNRSGGGWSPAVWPEFNFDRYDEVGRGYSVWGLGPGPWGHWSCGAHRGVYEGAWIHPWAQQQQHP